MGNKGRGPIGFILRTGAAIAGAALMIVLALPRSHAWSGESLSVNPASGPQTDWQKEHDKLKAKIDKEFNEPPEKSMLSEYLRWMGIKAADREAARGLAAAAQSAGNPYWFEKLQDLAEYAQESGKCTVNGAIMWYLNLELRDGWLAAVGKANGFGKDLFKRAKELDLHSDEVRETARCLMRYAIGDVESNPQNNSCLYRDREVVHGTQFDQEGNLLLPTGDYEVNCLPRSAFHTQSEGDPWAEADRGLQWVQMIRDVCKWFDLFEYSEATDLMEQYLMEKDEYSDFFGGIPMEVLCMLPWNKGHAFFLKLAEDYDLPKAKEYIEGFYAKLKGKVEYEDEDGKREPAPGAVVTVADPHDGTERIVEADKNGNYEIEKVILHKTCGPFPITAEYKGYKEEDEYEGPLEEPNKDFKHEKDLLVRADAWDGTIGYRWTVAAGVKESALAGLSPGGKYDIGSNWRLRLKFKRDRGNENVVVYGLDQAVLEVFEETLDYTGWEMRAEAGSSVLRAQEKAEARRRALSRKECDLELAVNLKKKTYAISGKVAVEGIDIDGRTLTDTRVGPIKDRRGEGLGGTTGIDEEIDIDGTFTDEKPTRLRGTRDEMEKIPSEFQEFFKALAGKIDWKFTWDLAKKRRD